MSSGPQDLGADNRFKVPLYEVSGVTAESRPCYNLVVVDYPKGMPSGPIIREARQVRRLLPQAARICAARRAAGPAGKKTNPPVDRPASLGAADCTPTRPDTGMGAGACLLAGVGLFLIGRRVWRSRTARQKRLGAAAVTILAVHPASQANPVDNWLQHVEQGEPEDVPDEPRP